MIVLEPDWLCWDGFGRLMRPASPEQDTVNPALTRAAGKVGQRAAELCVLVQIVIQKELGLWYFNVTPPSFSVCLYISLSLTTGVTSRIAEAVQYDTMLGGRARSAAALLLDVCSYWGPLPVDQYDVRSWHRSDRDGSETGVLEQGPGVHALRWTSLGHGGRSAIPGKCCLLATG